MKKTVFTLAVAALVLTAGAANANDNLDGKQIIEKSLISYYYPGDDGKAVISMELIDKKGGIRKREMVMLRINVNKEKGGDQKFFVYFKEPGDVREMTFMVHKHPGKEDNRWLFVPSVKLVRRIAADDKRSSFVGSDFTYEDVSGRHVTQDTHSLEREESLDGVDTYVVKSVPNDRVEYAHKLTWVRKDNFLAVKEEYFDGKGELFRRFTAKDIKDVDSFPTPMTRIMEDLKAGTRTVITIDEATYNLSLKDNDFSERRMRRPPRSWIR